MSKRKIHRRQFLKEGSVLAACVAAGALSSSPAAEAPAPKILNHNPKMGYRRLGKTGILISEVSLGGHGAAGYDDAAVENRKQVLERAEALGMNYVDTNIVEECELYGKALRGKRDRWHIGFGSWPERLTSDHEAGITADGMMGEIEKRLQSYHTETLDLWRPVGATWGDGQTKIPTMLEIGTRVLDTVVEVFEKARKQGKVRWLGVSAHKPTVFRRVLNDYPQFSVILFPYLFTTKELEGESLLELAREKDVGVIGIKPFAAGTTFGLKPQQLEGKVDPRAHLLVKEMLKEKRLSAILPGVTVPEQLDENVKGSYERDAPAGAEGKQALLDCRQSYLAHLTPEYSWLRQWEAV